MVNLRGIDPDTLSAMASAFYPVVLVQIDWPGEMVHVHSGVGVLAYDGHDWLGVGDAGGITLPGETMGMAQQPGTLTIGGAPVEIDEYLSLDVIGRSVQVLYGVVTSRAGTTLIGQPFDVFECEIDGVSDEQTPDARSISLQVSPGPSQRSAGSAAHSFTDQSARFPDDTGGRLANAALSRSAVVLRW